MQSEDLFTLFLCVSALHFILIILICIFVLQHDKNDYLIGLVENQLEEIRFQLNYIKSYTVSTNSYITNSIQEPSTAENPSTQPHIEDTPPPPYSEVLSTEV